MHPQPGPLALSPSCRSGVSGGAVGTGYVGVMGGTVPGDAAFDLPVSLSFHRLILAPRVLPTLQHLGGEVGTERVTQAPTLWSSLAIAVTCSLCRPASLSHCRLNFHLLLSWDMKPEGRGDDFSKLLGAQK